MSLGMTVTGLYNVTSSQVASAAKDSSMSWLYTTAAVLGSILALEQAVWRYKKRHLPGDTWTIPIIGRFADSTKPSMENYKRQWDSGPLSAVSVFNIFIVIASTNEYSRKILNSPTYAEPAVLQFGQAKVAWCGEGKQGRIHLEEDYL